MKTRRQLDVEHRTRLKQAAAEVRVHLHEVGVLALQNYEVDKIVAPFCRIYRRDDSDNVRSLVRRIVEKAHADARKERRLQISIGDAGERFEEIKPRIKQFEIALEPARALVEHKDWEDLQTALIMLPGILDDMALPELKAGAQALLEIYKNLRIVLRTERVRIPRGRGRMAEVYPSVAIETLVREWLKGVPSSRLTSVSAFPNFPRSETGLFAAFSRAAWHDLAFEPDDLTKERLNSAITTVRTNRLKGA